MTEIVDLIMDHRLCRECIAMKSQAGVERVATVLAQLMRHFVISARATCEGCRSDTVVFGFPGTAKHAARISSSPKHRSATSPFIAGVTRRAL